MYEALTEMPRRQALIREFLTVRWLGTRYCHVQFMNKLRLCVADRHEVYPVATTH